MPNLAVALKAEIARIARKEIRGETEDIKKASVQYRAHIAALRRRIDALERQVKRANKATKVSQALDASDGADTVRLRFSPTRLAATRRKLGLSAGDFAALIGVSGQSIYKWESGESRPRAKQLAAIASVRGIGKREAAARVEAVRSAA